ncbi:glycoside hydrolase family 18 protein [Andreprevotia chitinilytica]|uniref:glycoside hydrolase family 18 protein n=1 Tax=Andreprevotia chitinilytica TaxID=396808 RepID=UPI000691E605|nr:glycoside hydrolase family 18 protein [Andreprevotia chitinilytica]
MRKLLLPLMLVAAGFTAGARAESVVFQDNFDKDLGSWVGQGGDGSVPMHVSIVDDPLVPGTKAARFDQPVNSGDIFTKQTFPAGKYKIAFDYLGTCSFNCGGTLGIHIGYPGNKEYWIAGTANSGFPNRLSDNGKWNHYEFEFTGKFDFHVTWEQWDSAKGKGKDVYLKNLVLTSLGGSAPAAAAAKVTPVTGGAPAPQTPQSVMYFTAWGKGHGFWVKNLDTSGAAKKITVLEYAFGNVDGKKCVVGVDKAGVGAAADDYWDPIPTANTLDGQADKGDNGLYGHWNQLKQLKKKYPNLKVVISLGGWTWSKYFSDAALPANREAFVKSCVEAYIKGNVPNKNGKVIDGLAAGVFDGFDIDWEYPAAPGNDGNIVRPEDTQNYTALLAEFRKQLDAVKPGYLLTIAAPAPSSKTDLIELDKIPLSLNWINLMTYDFSGPWDKLAAPHSTLYGGPKDRVSIDASVKEYLSRGVPSQKIVLGVPFYGYGWILNSTDGNGLYQTAKSSAKGTYETGTASYADVKAKPGKVFRDEKTRAVWKLDGNEIWVYDDVQLIKDKIDFVKKQKLGGIMAWELSGDTPDSELVSTIYDNLIKQ